MTDAEAPLRPRSERAVPDKPTLDGIEGRWIERWETDGVYRFAGDRDRSDVYSIDTPPPTASGSLHVGHIFSYTHTDTVARYQRMLSSSLAFFGVAGLNPRILKAIDLLGMGKLVRAITGAVFDVAVDLRRGSSTFGHWVGRTLDAETPMWLWIPVGFAHGFVALRDDTRVYYKCTGVYHGNAERAIRHDDPDLGIEWPVPVEIISEKDGAAPFFKDSEHNFIYQA